MINQLTLAPEQLRRTIDPATLGIETTADLQPLDSIIGQERAVNALQFGLGIRGLGFNIFVAGEPGIGKMTAVRSFLEAVAAQASAPSDWCYVNNFHDPYQPIALQLAVGSGRVLQRDMKMLIERARRDIPKAFESEQYVQKREELSKLIEQRRGQLLTELRDKAYEYGFAVQATSYGVMTIPVKDGQPIAESAFQSMSDAEKEKIRSNNEAFQAHVQEMMKRGRDSDREIHEQIEQLDAQVAEFVVGGLIDDLIEKHASETDVVKYINEVKQDILANIGMFHMDPEQKSAVVDEVPVPPEMLFRKYTVNVLADNGLHTGAPVVVELNPSYPNLFGRIEKETRYGMLSTDFTMIKAGALHRANGGFLVLPIAEVLQTPFTWESLKRALRGQQVQIEEYAEQIGLFSTKSLKPQPIPLQIKVVLVGKPMLYQLLHAYDEDFAELFKVKADFDSEMPLTADNCQHMLQFIHTLCHKEHLREVDRAAAAKLLEYAVRLAENKDKLSTHFGIFADTLREADYWAGQDKADCIGAAHVQRALEQHVYRANLVQGHLREQIEQGLLLIDTSGQAVGQINGLSVMRLGDFDFGSPTRITASVEPGRAGVINIEREVAMSGPIHSKGVLILSGYLAHRYGGDAPITLSARVVFEQSYSGVEGDSASSTELYALLSALSGLPIKQGIAVTGSVNQHGQVQAIGGVNEKIEGFFDVCRSRGLTGEQGVMIPHSNVGNLMLREDVVEAVRQGQFHIWGVSTSDEGIEILTGTAAGERLKGIYPAGTVNALVEQRLHKLTHALQSSDGKPHRNSLPHRMYS